MLKRLRKQPHFSISQFSQKVPLTFCSKSEPINTQINRDTSSIRDFIKLMQSDMCTVRQSIYNFTHQYI